MAQGKQKKPQNSQTRSDARSERHARFVELTRQLDSNGPNLPHQDKIPYPDDGDRRLLDTDRPVYGVLDTEELIKKINGLSDTSRQLIEEFVVSRERLEIEASQERNVPEKAPALWAERTTGRKVSPADFIRQHYGQMNEDGSWDPQGLSRTDLKHLDPQLYAAYASWIRPERHPEDRLNLVELGPHNKIADAEEALQRRREHDRRNSARYRDRNRSVNSS